MEREGGDIFLSSIRPSKREEGRKGIFLFSNNIFCGIWQKNTLEFLSSSEKTEHVFYRLDRRKILVSFCVDLGPLITPSIIHHAYTYIRPPQKTSATFPKDELDTFSFRPSFFFFFSFSHAVYSSIRVVWGAYKGGLPPPSSDVCLTPSLPGAVVSLFGHGKRRRRRRVLRKWKGMPPVAWRKKEGTQIAQISKHVWQLAKPKDAPSCIVSFSFLSSLNESLKKWQSRGGLGIHAVSACQYSRVGFPSSAGKRKTPLPTLPLFGSLCTLTRLIKETFLLLHPQLSLSVFSPCQTKLWM